MPASNAETGKKCGRPWESMTDILYTDIDPFCCRWLENLVSVGLLPKGDVRECSISEIEPSDLKGYTQCHFFCGIGGWPYALTLAGWGADRPVWTGSCPCQPLSVAGLGKGAEDERHLWPEFARLICECRPPAVFGEQVASSLGREWLAGIRLDLEAMGYAVGAADLCAASVGAPHIRSRLFWVANSSSFRHKRLQWQQGEQAEKGGMRQPSGVCLSGGVADTSQQGECGRGIQRPSEGDQQVYGQEAQQRPERSGVSFWHNSILIPCADGKWRRVPGRWVGDPESIGLQESRQESGCPPEPSGGRVPGRVGNAKSDRGEEIARISERQGTDTRRGRGYYSEPERLEIEPYLFLVSHGLPDCLGNMWNEGIKKIKQMILDHAKATQNRPDQILRKMRQVVEAETLRREPGGYDQIQTAEILLFALCQLKREVGRESEGVHERSDVEQNEAMRQMWSDTAGQSTTPCSPPEWGLDGQRPEEPVDLVHELSHEIAQCTEAAGIISATITRFPLANSLPGRVGLLRGAGNAIVPQVAAEFVRCFLECE